MPGAGSRREAAMAGHQRDEAAARRLLACPTAAVRATALGALARMDRLTDADVGTALTDPEAVVRRRAAETAVRRPAVPLDRLLADPDPLVVESACWALGERGDPAPAPALSALSAVATGHPDPLCREAAVAALGAIGDGAGLGAILAGTTDKPSTSCEIVCTVFSGACSFLS